MSNLGYFQLKSAPGAWTLQLAPGRSKELYKIQSSTGTVDSQADAAVEVSISTQGLCTHVTGRACCVWPAEQADKIGC